MRFVVQKHAARRLHYDFRLELDGVLKSWAVPKGPSVDPRVSALAVHVEDHPLEYATFEGIIPAGQYGGGTVMVWDQGTWEPEGDPRSGYRKGKLKFRLHGTKLKGRWVLVEMHGDAGEEGKNWLLKKVKDAHARTSASFDVLQQSQSATSGRSLEDIASEPQEVWNSNKGVTKRRSDKKSSGSRHLPDPADCKQAVKAAPPEQLTPQLPMLVTNPPEGEQWLHELKFDGYRILSHLERKAVRLCTRRGNDWTDRFPKVASALAGLDMKETILDGEVVVLARDGTSDFQALQNLMRRGRTGDIVYFVFDIPFYQGYDLTRVPLVERKALLAAVCNGLSDGGVVRYSDHISGRGSDVASRACRESLEGIVSKRADSGYQQRRSRSWVKYKCLKRQEFVVGGWTDPGGAREAFGSLLVGYYEDSRLVYSGRVGTGFNQQSLRDLKRELDRLAAKRTPFSNPPGSRGVHWVDPELVVEVQFTEWTEDGILRHPSFLGLREDKEPADVARETPKQQGGKKPPGKQASFRQSRTDRRGTSVVAGVRLTNAERVIYPEQGTTKGDLANYYEAVAEWILPHIVDRPLTLVRCPQGRTHQCFYQKHVTETLPAPVVGISVTEDRGKESEYVAVKELPGLITLVQFGVLEIHPWGSRRDKLDRPDRLVFDLDPGEGVPWRSVAAAAVELRERLIQLGLESFLRCTGGKGLHVVAPIARRTGWDELKSFAKSLAYAMTHDAPKKYVATSTKSRRTGRIYVDYLRNSRGATAVASYSSRARAGAPVAVPLRWNELEGLAAGDTYNIRSVPTRLSSLRSDPWEGFFGNRQSLTRAAISAVGQAGSG